MIIICEPEQWHQRDQCGGRRQPLFGFVFLCPSCQRGPSQNQHPGIELKKPLNHIIWLLGHLRSICLTLRRLSEGAPLLSPKLADHIRLGSQVNDVHLLRKTLCALCMHFVCCIVNSALCTLLYMHFVVILINLLRSRPHT